jgi:hypothetical protein
VLFLCLTCSTNINGNRFDERTFSKILYFLWHCGGKEKCLPLSLIIVVDRQRQHVALIVCSVVFFIQDNTFDMCITLKCEIILRTSSSKPRSIILSASSKHKYRQTSRKTSFLSNMSIKRPGVATII